MTFSRHKGEDDLMNPLTDKRKHYEHIGRKVVHQALHGTPIKKDMDLHKRKNMKEDHEAMPIRGRNSAGIDVFTKEAVLPMHAAYKKGGYIEKGEHMERVREHAHKKHAKHEKHMGHYAEGGHHFHDGSHVHHHHHYAHGGSAKKWIQGAISHPGALRKELHVKKGHDIPMNKLDKAAHSSDPLLQKRAILAETLKSFHKK